MCNKFVALLLMSDEGMTELLSDEDMTVRARNLALRPGARCRMSDVGPLMCDTL